MAYKLAQKYPLCVESIRQDTAFLRFSECALLQGSASMHVLTSREAILPIDTLRYSLDGVCLPVRVLGFVGFLSCFPLVVSCTLPRQLVYYPCCAKVGWRRW